MSASALVILGLSFLLSSGAPAAPGPASVPLTHGIIMTCGEAASVEDVPRILERMQSLGYDMVVFGTWVWTLPTPGSDVEQRAEAALNWCDRNGMRFFVMHGVNYGSGGEAGGLDTDVLEPERVLRYVDDWARVLHGHPSAMGVILGNEVNPSLGAPNDAPRLWEQYRAWVAEKYGTMDSLNAVWGTSYSSFADVGHQEPDEPGAVDERRYARQVFVRFYDAVFAQGLRPVAGDKLYGNKTSLDPFLHRASSVMTMTCWDDMVAEHPLWEMKCAADTTGKPLFNSEFHLYHDAFQFRPAWKVARYRYFTSALLGEPITGFFIWNRSPDFRPALLGAQGTTPKVLAWLKPLEPYLVQFFSACQRADLMVLVTESNYYLPGLWDGSERLPQHPLAALYAQMGALGRPWRYLLEYDLDTVKRGTLVVWSKGLRLETAKALAALPGSVRVLAVGEAPARDEYGRPLPEELRQRLTKRMEVVPPERLRDAIGAAPGLPEEYTRVGTVEYWWWNPKDWNFPYKVPYCLLEAYPIRTCEGLLLAVVNNTHEVQWAPIPWSDGRGVVDLTTGGLVTGREKRRFAFDPLDARLFLIKG